MSAQQVIDLELDQLQSNPLQPRGLITPESLTDLVESIRSHGILEPLVVAKTPAGYQIIAGERRWRAAKALGLPTVPVIIKETTPQGMLEMALVENVQREDLNPIDRAQAFLRLLEEFRLTNQQISQRIGKSPSYISNTLRLLSLPDAIKDGLLSGLIAEGHGRALASIGDTRMMVEGYKMILRENGSVRRAEEIARRVKKKMGTSDHTLPNVQYISDEIDKMRDEIWEEVGGREKSVVKLTRSRAETRLTIILRGGTESTQKVLDRIYGAICGITPQRSTGQ
ncbi:MAG: ParB/RepB/Spo0J family partition protein [Candidatus Shapirobacteria bacterium]